MNIECLEGTDKRLYELVAPLIMNPAIIRQNNNYPFKTSRKQRWYIALEDEVVLGFMPVKSATKGLYIDNYYIRGDDESIINRLLTYILKDTYTTEPLTAIVHKRHVSAFRKSHFQTFLELKNYDKMDYYRNTSWSDK